MIISRSKLIAQALSHEDKEIKVAVAHGEHHMRWHQYPELDDSLVCFVS